jgi:hypothetical protein
VFYYGKEFGAKKQKLKNGDLQEEIYKPLSVTQAGAEPDQLLEGLAENKEKSENAKTPDVNDYIQQILGASSTPTTTDEILRILGKG